MESKNKPPAFQFYAGDFLSDLRVSLMNMEERGVYITLLAYAWLEDGLPNKPEILKGLCGNPKNWNKIWGNVKECFTEGDKETINNRRLVKERDKLISYKKLMSSAGKKGAKSRWGNGKAITKPKPSHNSSNEVEVEKEDIIKEGFVAFWELYPKKQAKIQAMKSYARVFKENKSLTHIELISAVKKQMSSKQWSKDGGEFIPMPSTWLNQERWNDSEDSYNEHVEKESYRKTKTGLYIAYCSKTGTQLFYNSLQDIRKNNFTSPAGGDLLAKELIPNG